MNFFERVEKECKRLEREKNKKRKDFVTRKINFILNIKYILNEYYHKDMSRVFLKNDGYIVDLDKLIDYTDQVIEISSNITSNVELVESQRTSSNNNYELNLILTVSEKNELIKWFKEFECKYNSLEEVERKLIYHTLVEKENNTWLALNTNYSERTVTTLKNRAINEFYRQLKLGEFTSKEFLNHSHRINF